MSLISCPGGTEPCTHRRTGSRGVMAPQEAAGTVSRGGGPCGAGVDGSWSSGGTGGGEHCGGPRKSWVA